MSTAKSTTTTTSPNVAKPTRPRAASLDALNLSSLSLALPAIYLSDTKDTSASPSPLVFVTPAATHNSWSFGTSGATLLSGGAASASAPLEFESGPSALGLELMDLLAPPLSHSSSSDADSTSSRCATPVDTDADGVFDEAGFLATFSTAEFDKMPLTPIRLRASRCSDEGAFGPASPLAF
ncbi:hypothetical protein EIP86_004858 [Pleurotus ostreatoroseus]|nr:hypothetical protein EIP86_004858 [Pleurotus ostreatoroseus]